jgi:Leucine-rich repeat (LRR) protein
MKAGIFADKFKKYFEKIQQKSMKVRELYARLLEAWSNQNLNKITVTLINLYKNQQFGTLKQIALMISETMDFAIDPEARYFPRLMMLYHPDRGDFHRNEITRLAAANDYDGLLSYSHILLLNQIEEIAVTLTSYEDIDYSPVYEWDIQADGFTIVNDQSSGFQEKTTGRRHAQSHVNFYDAVKIRMYGKTKIEFPTWYLENEEEFELSGSDINDLEGIQYCIHVKILDLSENLINDLCPLWSLTLLEELNLADNRLEDIDMLSHLSNLRILDLSNNAVRDISPLMELGRLEYVDLSGTKVPAKQIAELEELGVTVAGR